MSEPNITARLRATVCQGYVCNECQLRRDAADEIERLLEELADELADHFAAIASYDKVADRWCTDGSRTAVSIGDRMVELGAWEPLDGGYGRSQFYRQKRQFQPAR